MTLPKNLKTDELKLFGFVIDADNPDHAAHERYNSHRYRCFVCGSWSAPVTTNREERHRCRACQTGSRPGRSEKQLHKLYLCCQKQDCDTVAQVELILKKFGLPADHCHDGSGAYLDLRQVLQWSGKKQAEFQSLIGNISKPKSGARVLTHPRRRTSLLS